MSSLNSVAKDLHSFWDDEREFLGRIRNALAAHREHDAIGYLSQLEALEPLDVMQRAAELSGRMERLIAVLTQVAMARSGTGAIVRDMLNSSKRRGRLTRG